MRHPQIERLLFRQRGRVAGIAYLVGTEFHWRSRRGLRLNRQDARGFLRPLFERHGFLTTRLFHGDTANRRFNRLFGFEPTWSDSVYDYFICTSLPFGGKE